MLNKKSFVPFGDEFSNVKNSKELTKREVINLARKVATALEEENERLEEEKEQQNYSTTGFFL